MDKVIRKFIADGIVDLPSSKSYSHRYLIASFLSSKKIDIKNLNNCNDVQQTSSCLESIKEFLKKERPIECENIEKDAFLHILRLNAGDSGSTLRMLLPLALEISNNVQFEVNEKLSTRPLDTYEDIFSRNNIYFEKSLRSISAKGSFKSYDFEIQNPKSSQFISGLLFLIAYKQKGTIKLNGVVESLPYIYITIDVLKHFGYEFKFAENKISFLEKKDIKIDSVEIEKDLSALPYFFYAGLNGNSVSIKGINFKSLQGDLSFISLIENIGAKITKNNDSLIVQKSCLSPFNFDISNCIDLGPITFVLAATIDGTSTISGISRLKDKESDRLNCMITELRKLGIDIKTFNNKIEITGKNNITFNGEFGTYNDHRIAMALTALSSVIEGVHTIKNYECVNKSYPNFYKDFLALRKKNICCSIYNEKTLETLKNTINCAVLNNKYSYLYENECDLDKCIKICKDNKIEPIIALNRIIMEDELDAVSNFIDQYSKFKFLVSDLGVITLLKEKGLSSNIIYDPDTLICNSSDLSIYQSFGFDSTSMSNEITVDSLIKSYDETKADIFYQVFGRKMMFYSKRKLIKLYKEHKSLNFNSDQLLFLDEKKRGDTFLPTIENENGFFVFRGYNISLHKEINSLKFLKYFFFECFTIEDSKIKEIIECYIDLLNDKISMENADKKIRSLEPNIEDGFTYSDTVYVKEKVHQ